MDRFVIRAPSWKTMNYNDVRVKTATSRRRPDQQENLEVKSGNRSGVNFQEYVSCPSQRKPELADVLLLPLSLPTIPLDEFSNNNLANQLHLPSTPPLLPKHLLSTPKEQNKGAMMARIQQDLNSPSATVRIRAIKALKSPTKSAYSQFDVSHTEQSIITAEERRTPPPPPSIQELMRDIVVYVEVRTGEDNRSAGVKKVISALGARINDKLLRDTTHVIFKDGLLSTYKKAINWNIPVVSILWIEACKNKCSICDPAEFPISNIDRYENPELYDKMKRHKSMQPDSECNKRVRNKPGTPKAATPTSAANLTAGATKKTFTLIGDCSTPTSARAQKTDIRDYMSGTRKMALATTVSDSPAMQLISRFNAKCFTPTRSSVDTEPPTPSSFDALPNGAVDESVQLMVAAQTLEDTPPAVPEAAKRVAQRRRSALHSTIEMATTFAGDLLLEQPPHAADTPGRMTRRRTSLFKSANAITPSAQTVGRGEIVAIVEEEPHNVVDIMHESGQTVVEKHGGRRTTFGCRSLDMSPISGDLPTNCPVGTPKPNTTHKRRTLYTPQRMEQSHAASNVTAKAADCGDGDHRGSIVDMSFTTDMTSSTRLHAEAAALVVQTQADVGGQFAFSSVRRPSNRRTLFDVSMDIITHRLQNINQSARRSVSAARPETADTQQLRRNSADVMTPSQQDAKKAAADDDDNSSAKGDTVNQNDSAAANSNDDGVAAAEPKKKRKLFMPNSDSLLLLTPPTLKPSTTTTTTAATSASSAALLTPFTANKRRRTIMPFSQPQSDTNLRPVSSSSKAARPKKKAASFRRRSTLDFVERNSTAGMAAAITSNSQSQRIVGQPKALPAAGVAQSRTPKAKRNLPFLVYTNMHKEQAEVIREAVQKLGRFQLERRVNDATTHVVSLEPRRTLNMLRGLVRGLWLLEYAWVQQSLIAGKWLCEEHYELRDFSRAVEICRAERQAFGRLYRCELFKHLGAFYVSSRCGHVSKGDLSELIALCGGHVVEQRSRAKYILGNVNRSQDDKIYVTPMWILDSITHMQLLRAQKYACPIAPASVSVYAVQLIGSQLSQAQQTLPTAQSEFYL